MHVRLLQKGKINIAAQGREEHQASAEIVFISAHDTEIKLLAAAHLTLDNAAPSLTLTNYLSLPEEQIISAYVQETVRDAKLVVLRIIGGETYWADGIEALKTWAQTRDGVQLLFVPGGQVWDEGFAERSTGNIADVRMLWRYLSEGGEHNCIEALRFMGSLIGNNDNHSAPVPMPVAGFVSQTDAVAADVMILVYRALAQAGDLEPVEAMQSAFAARGLKASAVFVTSLKDIAARSILQTALSVIRPGVIINATAFSADTSSLFGETPVLQVAFCGMARRDWAASARGMAPGDLAMHVVMPELDGRIFAGPVAFKTKIAWDANAHHVPTVLQADWTQVEALADRATALLRLQRSKVSERRVAIILANYPNRDGRLANGVGLDTPQSCVNLLAALCEIDYAVENAPKTTSELMKVLTNGTTNALNKDSAASEITWSLDAYAIAFAQLAPELQTQTLARWGEPATDPFAAHGAMHLALHPFGNVLVGIQPSRGYDIDPAATFHDPALPPPHRYIATYLWLRQVFGAHAVVHLGKHGNLEWLPGKAVGLSQACWPAALIGPLPNIYPFIVNDPGEGVQAKRRTSAVIVDHLTPPLARAELHGDLSSLESLVDEYALAVDLDPRRAQVLANEIAGFASLLRLDEELDLCHSVPVAERVRRVDAQLCDLKEMQIRDGLHIVGQSPQGQQRLDLAIAIARVPRMGTEPRALSLHRAIASDLELADFDPLTRDLASLYLGPKPDALRNLSSDPWRTAGDTVERIEIFAQALISKTAACAPAWTQTAAVMDWITTELLPMLDACGDAEHAAILHALEGRHIAPGPSGAPSRGRPDVLPTGRNFYAVDPRAVPTPAAWHIGRASAEALVHRHWAETGEWLRSVAFSAWGTANMRTGGDDVAQALALIGCRPVWEPASGRVTGFEVLTSSQLKRPRVDVIFRVSGLFRDAFPTQLDLIDSAVRMVAALDEDDDQNPIAASARLERKRLEAKGTNPDAAERMATTRVFGSMPGAYGAGLQAPIDSGIWTDRADLAGAYLAWGSFAYGGGQDGQASRAAFEKQLYGVQAIIQTQDNREHDILDSDDYYQFMGGLSATVEMLSGSAKPIYLTDTSRPEQPLVRTLSEEIARVVRGRAANPKWIAGVMRHGYKGAFEMTATLDYLFAFAATTNAVKSHHFDQLFDAYLADEKVRTFIDMNNPAALREMAGRFEEAVERNLWHPRSNRARALVKELMGKQPSTTEFITTSEVQ